MSHKKTLHFFNELVEKHQIPKAYKKLSFKFNNKPFYKSSANTSEKTVYPVETYIAFPGFLTPKFNSDKFKAKCIEQKNQECFGIILSPEIKTTQEYLVQNLSKNSRSPILKKKKRLEACFNITYKVFFGNINKDEYDRLMDVAHAMLIKRFEQRNDSNFILKNWNKYLEILYPLINQNKASFFVIYNENIPIQISINFHYDKTFFAYIPAYNIDYAQFGLGNTAVYKQLEWCIENKYEYLDMGNGDLEYKVRWCNHQYSLETHIVYVKKNIVAQTKALIPIFKVKLINFLKSVKNLKKGNKKHNQSYKTKPPYKIETIENNFKIQENEIQEINFFDTHKEKYLSKIICDFIYSEKEHLNNIKIYNIVNTPNYIIKTPTKGINVSYKT
ncbi:GNAT family N-acetyltransferase [Seonamhaeicola sp. NFXS20]|uniref:GNAT family N-acetyltransferase n=1 Tax=Seonamhaeicola sp. NFXS20 TaxID=2816959 RepID=UPI003B8D38BC